MSTAFAARAALFVAVVILECVRATVPVPGDVCFTSRAVHSTPVGDPNTRHKLTTDEAAVAFHATRLDWVYTVDAAFIANASAHGTPVTAAINANVPDSLHGPATYKVGRIVNLTGAPLTAPWMRGFSATNPPYYGCVNNPAYVEGVLYPRALAIANMGVGGIQHDDPHVNAEAVSWHDGGCYCSHCMTKFRRYAAERGVVPAPFNATTFDYAAYLLARGGYGRGDHALRAAFEAFQFESAVQYQVDLRAFLFAQLGRPIAMSCNNGAKLWDNVTRVFDFAMGELAHENATPDQLKDLLLEEPAGTVPRGKAQVVTMPKLRESPLGTPIKILTRKTLILAALLGGHMLAPWDIYMPGPGEPSARFFGNASDFADVNAWIRQRGAEVVEAFSELRHTWEAGREVVRVTSDAASRSNDGDDDDSDVYWLLREKTGTTTHADVGQHAVDEWMLAAVDWAWPRAAGPVAWPLPANPGAALRFGLNVSSVSGSGSPSSIPKSINVTVVGTEAGEEEAAVTAVVYDAATTVLSFTTPADANASLFRPFGVFRIRMAW